MSNEMADQCSLPRAVIEENELSPENNHPVEPHSPSMDRSDTLSNNDTYNDVSDERFNDRRVDVTHIPGDTNDQFSSAANPNGNNNVEDSYRNSEPTNVSDKSNHLNGDDSFMNTDKSNTDITTPDDLTDAPEQHIESSKYMARDTIDTGDNTETRNTDNNIQSSGEGLQLTETFDNQNETICQNSSVCISTEDADLQKLTTGYNKNHSQINEMMHNDESLHLSSKRKSDGFQTTTSINEETLDQNKGDNIYTEINEETDDDIRRKLALQKLREKSAKISYDDEDSITSQEDPTAPDGAVFNEDGPVVRKKEGGTYQDESWVKIDREQYRQERMMKNEAEKEYEYFWKTYDMYSQWHPSEFKLEDKTFTCAEQYMMFRKATLFEDYKISNKIMKSTNPSEMKRLGRKVIGFSEDIWACHCLYIVKIASKAKFLQNDKLKEIFLSTYPKILVESSPVDKIWGIGLHKDDPAAWNKETWCGKNYLGYILTEVRDEILYDEGVIESKDRKVYIEKLMENVKGSSSVDKGPVKNKNAEPKRTESSTSPSDATASTPDFDKEEITNASAIGDSVHSPLKVEEEGVDGKKQHKKKKGKHKYNKY